MAQTPKPIRRRYARFDRQLGNMVRLDAPMNQDTVLMLLHRHRADNCEDDLVWTGKEYVRWGDRWEWDEKTNRWTRKTGN